MEISPPSTSSALPSLSIGEVSRRTGMRTSALRYYESMGLLPSPQRINGRRRFGNEVLNRIRTIQAAQQVGLSLEEIKSLLIDTPTDAPYSERVQVLARRKLREVEALIARAVMMKRILEAGISCQCLRVEDCALFLPSEGAAGSQREECRRTSG